jgi:hypothetical protein
MDALAAGHDAGGIIDASASNIRLVIDNRIEQATTLLGLFLKHVLSRILRIGPRFRKAQTSVLLLLGAGLAGP